MLPRIEAQEQMSGIQVAAMGSGGVSKNDFEREMQKLRMTAVGGHRGRGTKKPQISSLAAMGFAVKLEPVPPVAVTGSGAAKDLSDG